MKVRPAQATLNELRDGRAMDELAQHIHDAIAAVKEHGKAATVTLTIGVAPFKQQSNLIEPPVILTGEVTSKLPKPDPEATLFFVDGEGNPTRNKLREPELNLTIAQQPGEKSNG